jgi:hypothetical protein
MGSSILTAKPNKERGQTHRRSWMQTGRCIHRFDHHAGRRPNHSVADCRADGLSTCSTTVTCLWLLAARHGHRFHRSTALPFCSSRALGAISFVPLHTHSCGHRVPAHIFRLADPWPAQLPSSLFEVRYPQGRRLGHGQDRGPCSFEADGLALSLCIGDYPLVRSCRSRKHGGCAAAPPPY